MKRPSPTALAGVCVGLALVVGILYNLNALLAPRRDDGVVNGIVTPKFLAPPNESFVIASVDDTRRFVRERRVRFFDLGGSSGGSTAWFAETLARHGIRAAGDVVALDVDAAKVAQCNAKNGAGTCVRADVRALDWRDAPPVVSGVILFHVLEHLNALRRAPPEQVEGARAWRWVGPDGRGYDTQDAAVAVQTLRTAQRMASDFVLVRGPAFDGEDALNARGFARSYAAWHGHVCHFATRHVLDAFGPEPGELAHGRNPRRSRDAFVVAVKYAPIKDSSHPHVLPLLGERGSDEARRKGHKTCGGTLCDTHRCVIRRPRSICA